MPTDEQIWKMVDLWYQLTNWEGDRAATRTADERQRDFDAMTRHLAAFEADLAERRAGGE